MKLPLFFSPILLRLLIIDIYYEKPTVENAFDKGVYYPGPGTSLPLYKSSVDYVLIPITYYGPSTTFSGILYAPGPGLLLSVSKVFL